ncbi:MAG: dihydropteroate synthase, partial [Bacteroidales bacterium]|nr:dihydropteroate synthase [Bacteroidales bacterium]
FIDIGAVSTRPGSEPISENAELHKLTSAIEMIREKFPEAILSADTYRSKVAEEAINAGASVINDISGGTFDEKMFDVIAKYKTPYIMMHIRGTPQNMQRNPVYLDVFSEIKEFFQRQIRQLATLGAEDNIVLDPGFGFGKTAQHNYELLEKLAGFKTLGFPVMAGISRKSMINKILGTAPKNALNGTTTLNTIALLNGADILRVHDVKEAIQVVKLVTYYKQIENKFFSNHE